MTVPFDFIPLDLETTGVDFNKNKPVQSWIGVFNSESMDRPAFAEEIIWRQPASEVNETAHIHGITAEISANGVSPETAFRHLTSALTRLRIEYPGAPLVLQNAPFDLNMLVANAFRECPTGLRRRFFRELVQFDVLDTLVLDKNFDTFRKGSRRLVDLARHYLSLPESELSTKIANAHDARVDCELTGRVLVEMVESYGIGAIDTDKNPDMAIMDRFDRVHMAQIKWHEYQRQQFERFKKRSDPSFDTSADAGWPLANSLADRLWEDLGPAWMGELAR